MSTSNTTQEITLSTKESAASTRELMRDTVLVINDALHGHGPDSEPPIPSSVMDKLTDGGEIGVEVFDDNPLDTTAAFTVEFEQDEVNLYKPGLHRPGIVVRLPRERLEQICSQPQEFHDNPMNIDVVWFKSRAAA